MAISNFKAPTFAFTELAGVTGSLAIDAPPVATVTFSDTAAPTFKITNNSSNAPGGVFLGSLTAGAVTFNAGNGSVGFNFSVADSALDFLAAGQQVVEKFNVTITESNGSTSQQTIQVTLTGTNDTPTIVAATATGTIQEVLPVTANPIATNGTISFKDADFTDTHTVTFTPPAGALGTFTATRGADSLNGATGTVGWTFSVPDNAVGVNQTVVQTYTVKITDTAGAVATQNVTITIHGHPDAPPTITSTAAAATGTITELAATAGSLTPDVAQGTITYTDSDVTDTHLVTLAAAPPASYIGSFALGAAKDTVNGLGGSVPWSFSIPDGQLDFLAAGQQLVQTYTIRITDSGGAFTDQVVTVTMTGTNDAPVITSAVAAPAITELAGVAGSALPDAQSGTLTFTDLDKIDTHTVTVVSGTPAVGAHAYVGTFTVPAAPAVDSTNGAVGQVPWSFSVPDGQLDYLAAGQKQVQTYAISVNDGHGGIASQTVTVTLTGTNDVPVITSTAAATAGAITETAGLTGDPTVHTVGGTITYTDPDLTDTHLVGFTEVPAAAGAHANVGTFALATVVDGTSGAVGSAGWTFTVKDSDIDYLAAGQKQTQTYNITIDDQHGGTVVQPVTVTLTGTNDAPVAQAISGNASNLAPVITLTPVYTDPDLTDTHSITVGPTLHGGTVTVNPDNTITYNTNNAFTAFVGTDSFSYTVTDSQGASNTNTATVNVSFDNLPTIVLGGSLAGSVTEIAGSAIPVAVSGNVLFSDIDAGQTHVGSVVGPVTMVGSVGVVVPAAPVGTVTFGAAAPDSSLGSTGSLPWTYSVSNSAIAFLGAGQTLTETFTAQVDDLHGGKVTVPLTVTITGTNDAPVITTATAAATVNELANTTNALPAVVDTATGTIAFTDADVADVHSVTATAVAQASGYVGALTPVVTTDTTGGVAGKVTWTFSAPDSALDFLGAGQTLVQNYNVTVDDGHGGTATQQVGVTLVGANDAPVASVVAATANGTAPVVIAASYTDPDLIDTHTVTLAGGATSVVTAHGSVFNNGNESFTYTAAAGFKGSDSFSYTVTDNNGLASTSTVNVTVGNPVNTVLPNPDGLVNDNWVVTQATLANQHIAGFSADAVLANDPLAAHAGLHVVSVAGANVSFNAATNFITYTPPGTGIADSFTYTTSDNAGNVSTATVNVQLWDGTSATSVGSAGNQAEWLIGTNTTVVPGFTLTGSAGADNLHIGTGGGTIIGGGGADTINTLNGANPAIGATHIVYGVAGHNTGNVDSSLGAMDTVTGFQHGLDSFDLKGFGIAANSAITAVDVTPGAGGQNGFTTTAVAGYFGAAGPGAGNAVVSEIDRVAGEVHIMVDVNHDGNFDPNVDMVIHVIGPKSNLVASDFHFS